ncbi:MAG: pyroglutamyl-peptidase I [Atopobiaceae bacterium]
MTRILVTGFQPFGGQQTNPSWEAVRHLPQSIGGAEVVRLQIPVAFGRAADAVCQAIDQQHPSVVLCVGQAGGRAQLTPEFVAINHADARIPDNDGQQPHQQRIVPDGPDAHFATVPVYRMVDALQKAGIPAKVSYSAGTYVCNDVMYRMLHHLEQTSQGKKDTPGMQSPASVQPASAHPLPGTQLAGAHPLPGTPPASDARPHLVAIGGFVHVPFLPQQAAQMRPDTPSMSLDLMVRGLETALEVALEAARASI